ncbi:MAG: hypothetical protein MZU84_05680 [Sphingobacterium sp.]|nr:hypothetical protein [Sphingobacterium sp.]
MAAGSAGHLSSSPWSGCFSSPSGSSGSRSTPSSTSLKPSSPSRPGCFAALSNHSSQTFQKDGEDKPLPERLGANEKDRQDENRELQPQDPQVRGETITFQVPRCR